MFNDTGTIITCSTGLSKAAISVIRISGFTHIDAFKNCLVLPRNGIIERYLYRSNFTSQSGEIVDDVMYVYFKGPKSYTGENLLEIHCHGNPYIVSLIMEEIASLDIDVRQARAGEFSYRAYKNGKLSLSQIEGLDLVLNSTNFYGLNQGLSLLDGELFLDYKKLHDQLLKLKSSLELLIDFSDDVGEDTAKSLFNNSLSQLSSTVESLAKRCYSGADLLNPSIVLYGLPNAGKSSLFNYLIGNDRSIVSEEEGTTRDYVSESVFFQNTKFSLIDTAGLRHTTSKVESIGIQKAVSRIENAFFRVMVIDPTQFDLDIFINQYGDFLTKNIKIDLFVYTHSDVENFEVSVSKYLNYFKSSEYIFVSLVESGPIEPRTFFVEMNGPIEPAPRLRDFIGSRVTASFSQLSVDCPISISRHVEAIKRMEGFLRNFEHLCKKTGDVAILSNEVNTMQNCIYELIGVVSPDDVLNNIFNNFCIGK